MSQENPSAQDGINSASSSEHSLFTNSPIGIITTTPEGQLLSANPAMAKMFSYDSPQELIESVKALPLNCMPIPRTELRNMSLALYSQFHDLGKVGIPDRIPCSSPGP